jgi:hypothetical protein
LVAALFISYASSFAAIAAQARIVLLRQTDKGGGMPPFSGMMPIF